MTENELSKFLVNIFFEIHKEFGPGLLESVYEELICYKLKKLNIPYERQKPIPFIYEEIKLDVGFRADIIVDEKVIVEVKAVDELTPVHYKQTTSYLKITALKLGLLVNFNVALIKHGIHRVVNKL